jgi:hypothetical protein
MILSPRTKLNEMTEHDGNGNGNGNGRPKALLPEELREELSRFLELSKGLEEEVASLSPAERQQWLEIVRRWGAPEARLMEIDYEIASQQQTAPTFHVPTAEGVATYRGFFGRNGGLDDEQKKQVRRVLQRAAELSDDEDAD